MNSVCVCVCVCVCVFPLDDTAPAVNSFASRSVALLSDAFRFVMCTAGPSTSLYTS